MDLSFSAADELFRSSVQQFIGANLRAEVAERECAGYHLHREEVAEWHAKLYAKGWAAPHWPEEYGGPGWTPVQKYIFELECGKAGAPEISLLGLNMAGPVICKFGSPEMQAQFLQPILRGDIWFCQGFSEPNAGSDLASLGSTGRVEGDVLVVNGQKTWTSAAHMADFMIALVRTRKVEKPQAGLSMVLIPMDADGVTVNSIKTIDDSHTLNEVFLDDVRVPLRYVVGDLHTGWAQAKYLLNFERTHNAYMGLLRRYVLRIKDLIDLQISCGLPKGEADEYHRVHALLEIDVDAHEWSLLRVLSMDDGAGVSAAASALKVRGSELLLAAGNLEMAVRGVQQLNRDCATVSAVPVIASSLPGSVVRYLYSRSATIFGGTNEIQKSIIWNSLFGRAS